MRVALAFVVIGVAACGRLRFDERTDGGADASDAYVDPSIPIRAVGSFPGTGDLRRTLATSTSRTTFTFSTWYKSSANGSLIFDAGVSLNQHSYFVASMTAAPTLGTPSLVHQEMTTQYGAVPDYGTAPWPYTGTWAHIVCAVALTQAAQVDRVRWWVNGEPQPVVSGNHPPYPQALPLYLGDTILHTLGNKYDGGFDWDGSLAETYLIWGYALDASEFVAMTPTGLHSIAYTGPITAESLYFNYEVLGDNLFAGQPDWNVTGGVVSSNTDLPY